MIKTDMLYESFIKCVSSQPFSFFLCLYWLVIGGKVLLKNKLAEKYKFDPKILPYNTQVIDYLNKEKQKGAKIYLATATHEIIAIKIADFLGFCSGVFATNREKNLKGEHKVQILNQNFGERKYIYIGNSSDDFWVWKCSNKAICVNLSKKNKIKLTKYINSDVEILVDKPKFNIRVLFRMLRVHQWSKNLLLFVPIITANLIMDFHSWILAFIAFISFSCMASCVYIINDLVDLDSDRSHITKCKRPLASGDVSILTALGFVPFLLGISILTAFSISERFVLCLITYSVITTLYSLMLKKKVIIDCLTLSFLYTFRMLSGIIILNVAISLWLISFSGFFFLSLAFIKRIAELKNMEKNKDFNENKRGYKICDITLLSQIGVASGYISTLIFALYVNSSRMELFNHPTLVCFCGPVLVYWITYMFFKTNRGEMDEDPVIFAIRDKHSLVSGLIFCLIFIFGLL